MTTRCFENAGTILSESRSDSNCPYRKFDRCASIEPSPPKRTGMSMSSKQLTPQRQRNNEDAPPPEKLRNGPLICCLFGVSFALAGIKSEPNQASLKEVAPPTGFVQQSEEAIEQPELLEPVDRSGDHRKRLPNPHQIATPDTPRSASSRAPNSSEFGWEPSHPSGQVGSFTHRVRRSRADRL